MIGCAGQWTQTPATTALQPKNKMLIFGLRSLLMIDWVSWWTWTPSATPLQPKKWNADFLITFNFWWSARLVDGLKPHPPPLSTQKNEMLIFGLHSTSDDWPGWSMDSNSLCHLSPAKNMKCYFLTYVQLLMIGWAGQWTQTPSSTPLQPKKWNTHFFITFNMWCWPDWSMDLKLIQHPSPAKKWNAHFWITFNFWWLAGLVDGLKPHPPPVSSQKNEILVFILCWSPGNQPGWLMDTNPICYPSAAKKMKCTFLDFVQILMIGWAGWWTQTPATTPLHPKKMKCSFLDYVQLLMIGWAGQWTETPSATPLQPKNEMLIFGLRSTSDDWLGC